MSTIAVRRPDASAVTTTLAIWAVVISSTLIWIPGIDLFRLAAVGLVAVAVAIAPERRRLPTMAGDRIFVGTLAIGLLVAGVLLVADLLRDERTFAQGDDIRLMRFLVLLIAGRALFAASRPAFAARWVGWLASVTILGVLGVLFARAGVNPASVLSDAIAEGRFRPILNAFRVIHQEANERAGTATMRHFEVRAMVVGSLIGMALLTARSRRSSVMLAVSAFVVAAAVAGITFSRGNMLVVVLAMVPAAAYGFRRAPMLWRVALPATIAIVAAAVSRVGVVSDALGDGSNNSSEVRNARLDQGLGLLDDAAWRGVPKVLPDGTFVSSPHNMVLDLWLGGGFVAGLAGAALVALAVTLMVRTGVRALRTDSIEELAAWTGVFGLFVLVVVRMLTGGGGLLDPATWFGFGAALALRTGPDSAFAQLRPSTGEPSPN